jgi:hypothetical protein
VNSGCDPDSTAVDRKRARRAKAPGGQVNAPRLRLHPQVVTAPPGALSANHRTLRKSKSEFYRAGIAQVKGERLCGCSRSATPHELGVEAEFWKASEARKNLGTPTVCPDSRALLQAL